MRSGELARLAGVSTDTLRYYERKRILPRPARTAAGYRQYPPEALERVRLVRRAIAIGFGVEELAKVLQVRERGGAPCRQVHALAVSKLAELDRRIAELSAFRGQLQAIVAQWAERLERTPQGSRANLLETLILPERTNQNDQAERISHSPDGRGAAGAGDSSRVRRPPRGPRNGLLA
jgi:DNA-binding transcriptional MerR regulator